MALVNKQDPKKIFASQAPSQDVPAEFNNYERGWGESRKNNGKPTIKQSNKLQQLTDEKILWMHQNGAALPFDETMEYAEGAVVVKDGVLQQWKGEEWKSVIADGLSDTVQTFNTPEAGVDPVTGVADGAYFNARSEDDDTVAIEYQNVGGVAVATGKSWSTAQAIDATKAAKSDVLPAAQTKDSFKNAYSAKRTNQFNKLRDTTACGRSYIWKNPKYSSDSAYRFSLGINQNGWKTAEWDFIADADGFYRMRFGYVGDIRSPTTTITATNLSKTPQRAGDNAYFRSTTELNATFDVVFNGVGILFNHYVDNNGGIFEVSVDGGAPFIISTHVDNPQNASAVSARMSNKIGGNLEKTTHTATFKFIGNDPKYPPVSGISRGWFKFNDGIAPEDYTANLITGDEMGLAAANTVLLANNILEFAINATPVGSGFAGDWVPAHGSASGAMVINKRTIFIDNDVLDDTLSIISSEREIKEFTMVQEYTAYNTSDSSKLFPMWSGTLITKFNRENGLSYNHSFARDKDAAYDIFVTEGYTASCSGQRQTNTGATVFTKIIHDNGFEVDISAPPPAVQITHLSGILKSVMWIGPKYGLAMNVESPESSGAVGRDTTDGVTTFTTERPDRFNKVYFKPLGSNRLIKAGEEFNSKHDIWLSVF